MHGRAQTYQATQRRADITPPDTRLDDALARTRTPMQARLYILNGIQPRKIMCLNHCLLSLYIYLSPVVC